MNNSYSNHSALSGCVSYLDTQKFNEIHRQILYLQQTNAHLDRVRKETLC